MLNIQDNKVMEDGIAEIKFRRLDQLDVESGKTSAALLM